jgi:DNA-binding transcriptional ArsR family regulator
MLQTQIQQPIIDFQQVRKTAAILRALNHQYRQMILEKIAGQGRITVTDLYISLRDEQSIVSQHLRILREAAIVRAVRKGKYIYYEINDEKIAKVQQGVTSILA